jgi:imidazolonepropionase-like amidohydrolase
MRAIPGAAAVFDRRDSPALLCQVWFNSGMVTILSNLTLLDGTGRAPLEDALVAIASGKIVYAGKRNGWSPAAGAPSLTLDLGGRCVIPGLIDAHVHLCDSGEPDGRHHQDAAGTALDILKNAQRNLAAGITTVRDVGGWNDLEYGVRRAISSGQFAGARMCLAGRYISITESGADHYPGMYRVADGVEAVRAAVREQVRNGADLIKLGVTGAVLVEDSRPGATHFNPEEIAAAVREADKFGRRVAAHAHGADGIRKAVEAGVHSIEHGTFLHQDRELITLMAQRGVFLVPTLLAGWAILGDEAPGVPEWILEKSRAVQSEAALSVKLAYAAGVPLAMGSDASTPLNRHGENALEAYWMHQAGLPPMDALLAATRNAAHCLGWESRLGTLERGKVADLVVVNSNPLEDLRRLADPAQLHFVMKAGQVAACHAPDDVPPGVRAETMLPIADAGAKGLPE